MGESHFGSIQWLASPDIEKMFSMPGGHVHYGELSLNQVFTIARQSPGFTNSVHRHTREAG